MPPYSAAEAYSTTDKSIALAHKGIIIFLGICLLWICLNAMNSIPAVDDFCYGARAIQIGMFQAVANEYDSWGGRYSSTLVMSAFAQSRALTEAYFLVPFAIMLANLLATRHFLVTMSIRDTYYQFVFFMIVISVFSFRESIFWLAGGVTYGIAAAIFLVLIAEEIKLLLDCLADRKNPTPLKIGLLGVSTFILAGLNETAMIAHIALLGQIFLLLAFKKRKSSVIYIIGGILLIAVAGALIVKYAPGNLARANSLEPRYLLRSIAKSFSWIFERYTHLFVMTLLVCYSSLIIFSPQRKFVLTKTEFRTVFSMLFVTLWASLFSRAYVLNGSGPSRTHTIDLMLLSLAAFITAWHIYTVDKEAVLQSQKLKPIWFSFVGIFLVVMVLRPGADNLSFGETLASLKYSGPLKKFMAERFELARTGKGSVLAVRDFPAKTRSVTFFDDIQQDPKDWRNICFANYFQLKSVQLQD
jgi:hypothetical protein